MGGGPLQLARPAVIDRRYSNGECNGRAAALVASGAAKGG